MRVVFSTLRAYGHFFQLLPLAIGARAAGHEVVYATGEERHQLLTEAGLGVVTAGGSTEEVVAESARAAGVPVPKDDKRPSQENLEKLSRMFCRLMPKSYMDDLLPFFDRFQPDLVIHAA